MVDNDELDLPPKNLKERIGSLRSAEDLSDVNFIVGESKTLITANKLILAASSGVFFAMFYGPLAHKDPVPSIDVSDVTPNGFSRMIRYIYTDDVTLENEDDAFETYKAADKYLISGLRSECINYLNRVRLKLNTVVGVLEYALCFGMDYLKDRCLTYIQNQTTLIMKSQSFLDAECNTVKAILDLNQLNVASENELLEMIIYWAIKQEEASQDKSLREIIGPVLPSICFESISPEEFCSFVEKYPRAFSAEESLSVLMNYMKPGSNCLPEWYKRGRTRIIAVDLRAKVCIGPEVLRLKVKRDSWYTENFTSCRCGVCIKDVFRPIKIHAINIEWKILNKDLNTPVSIDFMATGDDSFPCNPFFEVSGRTLNMESERNFLQVSFQNPVSLPPRLPYWIIVRLKFSKRVTVKYQEHTDEKSDSIHCKILHSADYIPMVSQLLFSRCT